MHQVKLHPNSVPLLRVMVSAVFMMAGVSHLVSANQAVQRLENARYGEYALNFGSLELLVYSSGGVMLAGLLFMAGIRTRLMTGILALVLIPITLIMLVGQATCIGPLFKNIAIMGGLLFLYSTI